MRIFLISVGVIALVYGLHRLGLFAESQGWLYYKTRAPRIRTLGLFEEIAEPRVEYLVEEQSSEAIRADQAESGEAGRHTS
jgi:hypothetical protein